MPSWPFCPCSMSPPAGLERARKPSTRSAGIGRKAVERPARRQNGRVRQVSRRRLCPIDAEIQRQAGRPASGRPGKPRRLCELFTGASCGFASRPTSPSPTLLKTYATSEMVALQYHEHIPQPDPLTNQDSEARFQILLSRNAAERRRSPSTAWPPRREVCCTRPATSMSPCDPRSIIS